MSITGINAYSPRVGFKANSPKKQQQYENPIDRGTERNLAVLSSVGMSALAGVLAGGLTTLFTKGVKWPVGVGIVAALGALGLTLPSKMYNTKVSAYTREKEMDVFSRQKTAQNNIYEDINDEIKDENVSLDDKINHYATVKMADNGSGVMVKGV